MTMFASCGAPKAKEKLIMATNANFPPYEFIEGEGGKVIGIDAEIAGKIAEKLGMEL
ncbi:MAG: transporter substrate-binding domain-containing protein, partial [Oscillospiraceae bacterium]